MAMSNSGMSDLADKLSCGVCFESYNESDRVPKALRCMHTLCLTCLKAINKKCPTCRANINEPITDVKTNFALLELLSLLPRDQASRDQPELVSPTCHVHRKSLISHYCMDCHKTFCDKCFAATVRKASSHYGHQILEYQDLQRDVQKTIQGRIQALQDKQAELHATTDDGKLIQALQVKKQEVKSEIASMASDLHLQIDIWQANLSCQTEDVVEEILSKTQGQVAQMAEKLEVELRILQEAEKEVSSGQMKRATVMQHSEGNATLELDADVQSFDHLQAPLIELTTSYSLDLPRLIVGAEDDGSEYRDEEDEEDDYDYEDEASGDLEVVSTSQDVAHDDAITVHTQPDVEVTVNSDENSDG